MKRILWGIQAVGILIVFLPFSLIPAAAGDILGVMLYRLWPSRRRIAIDNLMRSALFKELSSERSPEEIIRESFKNLGRSFVEVVKIYYGRGRRVVDKTVIKGMENLEKAIAKGKGVMFITGHCGNWELLAIASSFRGVPLSVVARPLNNPYLNRILEMARARFGNRIVYKKGALKDMVSVLKSNGCVGILMDQAVLPGEGYIIDFLGRAAWTTKVPALIARKTGASVVPAFIRRVGRGHEITIYPEVDLSSDSDREDAVRADTRKFSRFIETYIRENPSQWLWLHRRWKRAGPKVEGRHERTVAEGIV